MTNDPYQALSRLPSKEYKRLLVLARREFGWRGLDPEVLVQEACLRLLDGRRKWPANVSLEVCLWQIVRSLGSHEAERRVLFRPEEIEGCEGETAPGLDDGICIDDDKYDLARFRASLDDDPRLQVLLDGKRAACTQREIARRLQLSDASVTGLMRTLVARAQKFFDIER